MGKCTRKSKSTGEVAIMDVAHSSLGVWTRAKKLALQKSSVAASTTTTTVGRSYLQLRSRRLEKPLILSGDSKRQKHILKDACVSNPSPSTDPFNSTTNSPAEPLNSRSVGTDSLKEILKLEAREDLGFEACFGENVLESEGCCDRSDRESTPCSLIRDIENIKRNPCSTDERLQDNNNNRMQNIPTANEMEELFAGPEQHQQSIFIEKYNFDPVNEKPLPGRYEWEKLNL